MLTKNLYIEPSIKTISPKFDIEKLNHYKLLCEVSETTFACQVIDLADGEIISSENYEFPSDSTTIPSLRAIYETHDFLKSLKWDNIEIVIDNQFFTLIPTDLFKKEYAVKYLQLAKGDYVNPDEELHTNIHQDLGVVNIYSTSRELYNWFSEVYPLVELSYKHKTSQLIDFGVSSSKAQTAFLYFNNRCFTMVITVNGTLKYCNRFSYKTPQDLVYYILFVMNELGIEPDEIFLRLYGNISEQSEEFELMNEYLPNVKIGI
ncbi:MAG: DUF3822 family protein [Arcicella sp.]|nr:DUF3822 family protein [Arcicella sp.]